MEKEKVMLTEAGKKEREEELNHLKNVIRPQVIEAINEARAQGDLSENYDYKAAKDRQSEVESRIQYLEEVLANAVIIKDDKVSSVVNIGSTVELLYLDESDAKDVYTIVGSAEADPFNGKISNECLLAQAILGHKENEIVTVRCENPYEVKINKIMH